jgi:S1-C subfamily serine protease
MRVLVKSFRWFGVGAVLLVLAGCQSYQNYRLHNKSLCLIALQSEHPKWDIRSRYADEIEEAKRRGLTEQQCARLSGRFTEQQFAPALRRPSSTNYSPMRAPPAFLAKVSVKDICRSALQYSRPKWEQYNDMNFGIFVSEAKRRNLTEPQCARLTSRFTEQQISAVIRPQPVASVTHISDDSICSMATQTKSPKWDNNWPRYISEANRRGISERQCAKISKKFSAEEIATVYGPEPSKKRRVAVASHPETQKPMPPAVRPVRKPKIIARAVPKKPKPSSRAQSGAGSGFFVSRLGHVVTNSHVVKDCKKITVGDNATNQTPAALISRDKKNDLALLRVGSLETASAGTKSLVKKLGLKVVPLAGDGLLRSEDVRRGETVLVAGFPYGDIFSTDVKVTGGMVSSVRGLGDDSGQFQMDAAVQPGSSGGPIYDENGSVVGVVVAQLNKLKVAKAIGSFPENVNFGIKASTVRQFLTSSGLPSKWSSRSKKMTTVELAKIAQKQTLMVICHR